jgi:uncharacterized protein (TIGR03067 family)
VLPAFAALALGFAPAPFPRPPRGEPDADKADLGRLRGAWVEVRYDANGAARDGDGSRLVVVGSRFTFVRGGNVGSDWRVSLDAASTPRGMRWRPWPAADARVPDESAYRLDRDTLTLCYRIGKNPDVRPTDFAPGLGRAVMVLRRAR